MDAACREGRPDAFDLPRARRNGRAPCRRCGAPLEDIVLVPRFHVILQAHTHGAISRGAKEAFAGQEPHRPVAQVCAVWAAQRLKSKPPNQFFAFPQYTNETDCKAAPRALNAWLRRRTLAHLPRPAPHRQDQLRAVQCPKDISDAIIATGRRTATGMDTDMVHVFSSPRNGFREPPPRVACKPSKQWVATAGIPGGDHQIDRP
jgi:hypothetical protein